jgi:outer membrane protein assembly complex protein YaeT
VSPARQILLGLLLCAALPQGETKGAPQGPDPAATESSEAGAAPAPEALPSPPRQEERPAPAARISIVGYELAGARIDPDEKLQRFLATVAAVGEPFVPAGSSDEIGRPVATIPRLALALDAIGYRSVLTTKPAPGGLVVVVTLTPYERVRYVFVSGNRPIRQDEIMRRITIRAGRPLPPSGPERALALERERQRVIDFIRSEGYFEANVKLEGRAAPTAAGAVDLYVTVDLGPSYPVGSITFTGNHALTAEEMDPMFRHADWQKLWMAPVPFTQRQLREDMDALTKRYRGLGYVGARVTNDFSVQRSVDREAKNVHLNIRINERRRVQILFEGNSVSSASLLEATTLISRGSYDDYEVAASADAIQRYYQQHGYFFARVDWRREILSRDEERVIFVIDEGPELRVKGVDFVGNEHVPGKTLAGVVTVRTYPWLGLGGGGYVTGRQMEQDSERLVEYYRSKGYLEARAHADAATSKEALGMLGAVVAAAETVSRDESSIYVRFTVEEGPRTTLAGVDFRTDDGRPIPYDLPFLMKSIQLLPGEPYTPSVVREDAKRLERLIGDAGYPAGTIDYDVTRDGDRVTLHWLFKLGPRVQIGPIFVRGNFVTEPETILEQTRLWPGSYLTTTATERSQRNLGYLQLFNNATPISFPGHEDKRPVVPMVIEVEERYDQYSVIHVGAGASTEQRAPNSAFPFGVYGRVGYDNRNWFGHGWLLFSQLTYGSSLLRGNVSFLDRRLFGTFFRLDAALTYLRQETARLGDIRSGGGSIGVSREMYPGVDAGIHYNLRNTTHTESFLRLAGPDEGFSTVQIGTTVGSLSANVEWLRMDNRLLPTRGFKIDATAELALPFLSAPLRPFPLDVGDDTFLKVGVHSLSVLPLGRYLFLKLGIRFDHGFPLGGASLLPKVERDTTIRGFQLDRARSQVVEYPVIPFDPVTGGGLYRVEYRPLGGNIRILQNLDLQFPIAPPWYGSVFWDNGVVADSLDGLQASQFRHGIGISPLLIRLPIGDISLAWGWPLDPGPGDTKIGVFHVNVGLMF